MTPEQSIYGTDIWKALPASGEDLVFFVVTALLMIAIGFALDRYVRKGGA